MFSQSIVATGGKNTRVSTRFAIDASWAFGPAIKHLDKHREPAVSADWYKGRLQFQVFEEVDGDPAVSIRFLNGKIVEIEISRAMEKLICFEDQPSPWVKERDSGIDNGEVEGSDGLQRTSR